ncbi:MAG: helix-turn-helix domain-containing protein [Rhodospirillales bacterium]|nr:helix-turn-helix domain-containing protein [Rhodospirillales bacterium]MDH3969288.1 helix-turn-helix domain-containing protein [Rhodospirillales bacterium]
MKEIVVNRQDCVDEGDARHDRLYQALLCRDPDFDGRVFVGVRTTGIYCRTICPAPKPKRRNCVFYRTAAEAERVGFRPCLRCRPETAPGSPAWLGTATTVGRGMRLIEEGYLDDHSVSELADLLGIGARHLSRLFLRHAGANPGEIARVRRVQAAKRLITDSDLPLAHIAFEAGFGSLRRFNDAFAKSYKRPPSSFRRARSRGGSAAGRPR